MIVGRFGVDLLQVTLPLYNLEHVFIGVDRKILLGFNINIIYVYIVLLTHIYISTIKHMT